MPLKTTAGNHGQVAKGRGATINPEGRFEVWNRESADDGWFQDPGDQPSKPKTVIAIEHAKSVISRHDSPDVGFMQSINPYRGCEHACIYCLGGDTLILMANGRTKPLSELRAGDEIYGTREQASARRYTKARVLAHWSSIKPALRITLEDGTTLTTSGDHRFLTDRGWRHVTGGGPAPGQRPSLALDDRLVGTGAFAEGPLQDGDYRRGYLCGILRGNGETGLPVDEALLRSQEYLRDFGILMPARQLQASGAAHRPQTALATGSLFASQRIQPLIAWPSAPSVPWALGFLAGIFDAEGPASEHRRVSSVDSEILGWTARALEMCGFAFSGEDGIGPAGRVSMKGLRLRGGVREHLRFIHRAHPAITGKFHLEGKALESDARLRVVAIEPLGRAMRLFDITTTTEDFIANGVVSHNCFARPSHAYLGLSPGLDFETRLSVKVNAAEKLREEIARPGYHVMPLTIGVNTDAYQPIEREHRITRSILEVASETNHPVSLITKSALIERDLDLLASMAARKLVNVTLSVTTLDHSISMKMEPRTSAPARRLKAIERLAAAGIPVNVNVAPVVPFLTDSELEPILEAAARAGAKSAGYSLVRLPWEVKDIFRAWLEEHFPLKAAHVMSRVHQMRGGRDNDPNFGSRMVGQGLFAELLRQRFDKAVRRFGLDAREDVFELDTTRFRPPSRNGQQALF